MVHGVTNVDALNTNSFVANASTRIGTYGRNPSWKDCQYKRLCSQLCVSLFGESISYMGERFKPFLNGLNLGREKVPRTNERHTSQYLKAVEIPVSSMEFATVRYHDLDFINTSH